MNCFFRIWKASAFWCLDPANNLVNLPLSVQAQLRNVARKALYSLEHDILKELDDCIAQQGPPKAQERLAIWASMWQLIIIYRELLAAFKVHLVRVARERSESAQASRFLVVFEPYLILQANNLIISCPPRTPLYVPGRLILPTASSVLPLSVPDEEKLRVVAGLAQSSFISHHGMSKQRNILHYSTAARLSQGLVYVFRSHHLILKILTDRQTNHVTDQKIQASQNDMDRLLCVFIVNHELKKMNARKRIPKATASKAKGSLATIEDDCDDEAE